MQWREKKRKVHEGSGYKFVKLETALPYLVWLSG